MKKYLKIALLVVVAAIFDSGRPGKNDCGNRKGRTEGRDSH